MPIYEYRCNSCSHEFETIQKVSEEPLQTCPQCEQNALVKKVSAAGFRLKGGGWYETDFKSGSKRNVAGDKTPEKPADSTSSSSKSGDNGSSSSGTATKGSDGGSSAGSGKSD
jgi:putative FmdB family regulatory protein